MSVVNDALESQEEEYQPYYFVLAGSRCFGYAKQDSDYDVMGFYLSNPECFGLIGTPKERIVREKEIKDKTVELKSYEARAFSEQILNQNLQLIESIYSTEHIYLHSLKHIGTLRSTIDDYMPLRLPKSYYEMGKSLYHGTIIEGCPDIKDYIHAIKGLVLSKWLSKEGYILDDYSKLCRKTLTKKRFSLVQNLLKMRTNGEKNTEQLKECEYMINALIDEYEPYRDHVNDDYRAPLKDDLNRWLKGIRNSTEL